MRQTDDRSVSGCIAEEAAGESAADKARFAKDRRNPTVVTTDPKDFDQFERDNSWGQAIQLLENSDGTPIVRLRFPLCASVHYRFMRIAPACRSCPLLSFSFISVTSEDQTEFLCVCQIVEAGDWVQVTVQFTKLSMHVSVAPASAVGRRRRAQQQRAQPEPEEVWEEATTWKGHTAAGDSETWTSFRGANESQAQVRRNGWLWLDG